MGNKGEETPSKIPKSSSQEQVPPSSPATVFPDWASFQAYYNSAGTPVPPGFYHSPVASNPQGHPYMWAPQHMMSPYGTPPPPYVAMYPPAGMYPHPPVPQAGPAEGNGKNIEREKASGASTNGIESMSDGSGTEESSDRSDDNSQSGSQENGGHKKTTPEGESKNTGTSGSDSSKGNRKSKSRKSSHAGSIMAIPSSAITAPTTTLNIGMDYWGSPSSTALASVRSKLPITPSPAGAPRNISIGPQEIWPQDEREIKRQKRKQSNRESARRSRLRKQAEYDELAVRVSSLTEENSKLREELTRIREECERLASDNASLSAKLENDEQSSQQEARS